MATLNVARRRPPAILSMRLVLFKACHRCGGDLLPEREDPTGKELACYQCGDREYRQRRVKGFGRRR